jgi:hypothetical protein
VLANALLNGKRWEILPVEILAGGVAWVRKNRVVLQAKPRTLTKAKALPGIVHTISARE